MKILRYFLLTKEEHHTIVEPFRLTIVEGKLMWMWLPSYWDNSTSHKIESPEMGHHVSEFGDFPISNRKLSIFLKYPVTFPYEENDLL